MSSLAYSKTPFTSVIRHDRAKVYVFSGRRSRTGWHGGYLKFGLLRTLCVSSDVRLLHVPRLSCTDESTDSRGEEGHIL